MFGYILYGIVLLGIVALFVPPYQLYESLVPILSLLVLAFLVFYQVRKSSDKAEEPVIEVVTPATELPAVVFEKVRTVLEDARQRSYGFLKEKVSGLSNDDIRANIFLPEPKSSEKPDDYMLKIYPGLHLKMELPDECRMQFAPNQGATGYAFAEGRAIVTQRRDFPEGDWDDIYNIDDELAKIMHPDLKWIISMPLEGNNREPIGVMNIDGLRHQIHVDELFKCMEKLTDSVVITGNLIS